jgi:hypothetical protein
VDGERQKNTSHSTSRNTPENKSQPTARTDYESAEASRRSGKTHGQQSCGVAGRGSCPTI